MRALSLAVHALCICGAYVQAARTIAMVAICLSAYVCYYTRLRGLERGVCVGVCGLRAWVSISLVSGTDIYPFTEFPVNIMCRFTEQSTFFEIAFADCQLCLYRIC